MSDSMSERSHGEDFAAYIEGQRTELREARKRAVAARQQMLAKMDAEIARLDSEFAAIDAYEAAKTGKSPGGVRKGATTRTRLTRPGSRREDVVQALAQLGGATRGQLLEHLGYKGDKSRETSVSNALTQMQKLNQVYRDDFGRWFASEVQQDEQQAAE